jgi:hypothetical protein
LLANAEWHCHTSDLTLAMCLSQTLERRYHMVSREDGQERRAIILSTIFLVVGLIVVWVAKEAIKLDADAVLVSLLILPVIVFMVLSGKLEELKGPGGLEARFSKIARESITPADQTIEASVQDTEMVEKQGVDKLRVLRQRLNESKPTVMTMELGSHRHPNGYNAEDVREYLNLLSQVRNFKFVLFQDHGQNFVGYMPHWSLRGILELHRLGNEFIREINYGERDRLARYPGVITKAISSRTTNVQALQEMEKANLEALIVVDDWKFKGVVEREQLLSRMMLALAQTDH